MPPKVKITKEMIIDAAFEIARSEGAENINARTVSKKIRLFHSTCYVSFQNNRGIEKNCIY